MYSTVVEQKSILKGILKLKISFGEHKYIKFVVKPILNDDEIKEFVLIGYDVSAIMSPKKLLLDSIEKYSYSYLALFKIENFYDLLSLFDEKISEEFEKQVCEHIKILAEEKKLFLLDNGEFAVFDSGKNQKINDFNLFIKDILRKINEKSVKLDSIFI